MMDPSVRQYVLLRDGGCVARLVNSPFWATRFPMLQGLPAPGRCQNEFGGDVNPYSLMGLTLDHVKDDLAMSMRAPDDIDHLWTVCWGHHITPGGTGVPGQVWATHADVRAAARLYIVEANDMAFLAGFPVRPQVGIA